MGFLAYEFNLLLAQYLALPALFFPDTSFTIIRVSLEFFPITQPDCSVLSISPLQMILYIYIFILVPDIVTLRYLY